MLGKIWGSFVGTSYVEISERHSYCNLVIIWSLFFETGLSNWNIKIANNTKEQIVSKQTWFEINNTGRVSFDQLGRLTFILGSKLANSLYKILNFYLWFIWIWNQNRSMSETAERFSIIYFPLLCGWIGSPNFETAN